MNINRTIEKLTTAIVAIIATWLLVFNTGCHEKQKHSPGKEKEIIISGMVIRYYPNRIKDLDQIMIKTVTDSIPVFFPPHTAREIMLLAIPGEKIKAVVNIHHVPGNKTDTQYNLVNISNGKKKLFIKDIRPPAPAASADRTAIIHADHFKIITDDSKKPVALLTESFLIELKPAVADKYGSLFMNVTQFSCTALVRDATAGFVNMYQVPKAVPLDFTINGKKFLTQ